MMILTMCVTICLVVVLMYQLLHLVWYVVYEAISLIVYGCIGLWEHWCRKYRKRTEKDG